MEFGPRALGNRSILADPSNPEMKKIINSKIKNEKVFQLYYTYCFKKSFKMNGLKVILIIFICLQLQSKKIKQSLIQYNSS